MRIFVSLMKFVRLALLGSLIAIILAIIFGPFAGLSAYDSNLIAAAAGFVLVSIVVGIRRLTRSGKAKA